MTEARPAYPAVNRLRLEIDDPENRRIRKPAGVIRGWIGGQDIEMPETFAFHIERVEMPHRVVTRGDVEEAMPDYTIVAFDIPYDLASWLPYIENGRLPIRMTMSGYDAVLLRFQVEEEALASCLADAGGV